MPRPIVSRLEKRTLNLRHEPKNTNVTSIRCSCANQTSRHVRTRHVEHIFIPDEQTNQKLFSSCKQIVKCIYLTRLIVTTINPIPCRTCVHPSTFHKVLIYKFCSSKCREIVIYAHNYFRKQTQTKDLIALIFI